MGRSTSIFLVVLVILILGCLGRAPAGELTPTEAANAKTEFESQVSDLNAVSVKVSPRGLTSGSPLVFDVSMNTHSVELNYDLTQVATLIDDAGNSYQPTSWEGAPPGGHHRNGVLTFPPLPSGTKNIKLVFKDINGADRVFEWRLE